MLYFIGIDPGASGGIAIISQDDRLVVDDKMPKDPRDFFGYLNAIERNFSETLYFMELIQPMPLAMRQGANFGQGFLKHAGILEGILIGMQLNYELVHPIKWQNAMSCKTRGDKNVSKRAAQQLFQGASITHSTADAILIAEYGRRKTLGLTKK